MIVWCDLETTGLDPEEGSILEIAIVCTDDTLEEIGEPFVSLVRPLEGKGYEEMDDFVRAMHTKNGLIAELYEGAPSDLVLRSGLPNAYDVVDRAIEWQKARWMDSVSFIPFEQRETFEKMMRGTPLAGSSVHFDRAWMRVDMPELEKLFSHRHLDVSAFNEGAKRWAPKRHGERPGLGPDGKPLPAHRALDDIRASIQTARHYKERVFEYANRGDYLSANDLEAMADK